MMVIQVINDTGSDVTIAGVVVNSGSTHVFPADRCSWSFGYDNTTRQYQIGNVYVFGAGAGGTVGSNLDVQLGYIGKSGRFVAISE